MAVVPAIRQLRYEIEEGDIGEDLYLDLFRGLSLLNRRLYRQGQYLFVDSVDWEVDAGQANPSEVTITQIPNTWISKNAHGKAYRLWRTMIKQATDEVEGLTSAKPKWHDFKIFFNADHYEGVTSSYDGKSPMTGFAGGSALVAPSIANCEWVQAQIVIPPSNLDADPAEEFSLHMLGDDSAVVNAFIDCSGSKAIIQGYADTRITVSNDGEPPLPGDASTSWMVEMFDDGGTYSDIVQDLETFNDQPPYATGDDIQAGDDPIYMGGSGTGSFGMPFALLRSQPYIAGMAAPVVSVPGGELFCGLCKAYSNAPGVLVFNIALGTYKGVAAIPVRDR